MIDRKQIAAAVTAALKAQGDELRQQFTRPGRIPSFVLDDVLDAEVTRANGRPD